MSYSRTQILGLYKKILFAAHRFPSVKRKSIIEDIRVTFRQDAKLTDEKAIENAVDVAIKGLEQLSMYANLPKNSSNWVINLEKNPMPKQLGEENEVSKSLTPEERTRMELEEELKNIGRI